MDFTLKTYKNLITALQNQGFVFQTFAGFLENPAEKAVILRHDVDDKPLNSLVFAKIQAKRNISGTYYFRAVPQSWNETVIKEICGLGHEIGYHYESLTTCNGNIEKAYDDFRFNLEKLRQLAPVKTICMHGSSLSRHDNRDIWKNYDYREYGIIGEPYLDLDYSNIHYLTDTGRRWDGHHVSIYDRVPVEAGRRVPAPTCGHAFGQGQALPKQERKFKSTTDIIRTLDTGQFPSRALITIHPQRWTDKPLPWLWELVWQNAKNVVKKVVVMNKMKRVRLSR